MYAYMYTYMYTHTGIASEEKHTYLSCGENGCASFTRLKKLLSRLDKILGFFIVVEYSRIYLHIYIHIYIYIYTYLHIYIHTRRQTFPSKTHLSQLLQQAGK